MSVEVLLLILAFMAWAGSKLAVWLYNHYL